MLDQLDRKIRQMHQALDDLEESDLSSITSEHLTMPHGYHCKVDFAQGTTEVGLANIASLLIGNIACMKDHLKVWCSKNNKAFDGDSLIDSDMNVALVHDLWNIDKHAELDKPPRSGYRLRILNLRQTLNISTGASAGSSAMFSFDPRTRKTRTETQGGGRVSLLISGDVVDEHGNRLGDFADICEKAAAAWGQALNRAGVVIPVR